MSDLYAEVDFSRVSDPTEVWAIDRIIKKIARVKTEVKREAQLQDTRIFSAFDELDLELFIVFNGYERKDI